MSGTLSYGGPCTPGVVPAISGVKPYKYVVQANDGPSSIAIYFGIPGAGPGTTATNGWAALRTANPNIPNVRLSGDPNSAQYVVCTLQLNPGDRINIPANWPEPGNTSRLEYPSGGGPVPTCGANQILVNGQCADCPAHSSPTADGSSCACLPGYELDASGQNCVAITVPGQTPPGTATKKQTSTASIFGIPWWALLAASGVTLAAVAIVENDKRKKRRAHA